jgi:hypothetical protein
VFRWQLFNFRHKINFYNFALAGNLEPFEDLKTMMEKAIKERVASKSNDEIILLIWLSKGIAAGFVRQLLKTSSIQYRSSIQEKMDRVGLNGRSSFFISDVHLDKI